MQKATLQFIFGLLLLAKSIYTHAQHVTITPDGITPANNRSYPRLPYEALLALPSPQKGDIAYDLTFACLRAFNGQKWICTNQSIASNNTPNLAAIATHGGRGNDQGQGIGTDAQGNVYVAGFFGDTISFQNTTKMTRAAHCLFVSKYNSSGTLQWVQTAGGTGYTYTTGLSVDSSGNSYAIGYFTGTVIIGNTTLVASPVNFFIAKYNTYGDFQWVKTGIGGVPYKVTLDKNNNVYIAGAFSNTINIEGRGRNSQGNFDAFVAKYDSEGNHKWYRTAGSGNYDAAFSIAVDANENVYIAGKFQDVITFFDLTKVSQGGGDGFIARYSPDGVIQWAESFGGASDDEVSDIVIDANNFIYCIGSFDGSASFKGFNKQSKGLRDIFVLKLYPNRDVAWLETIGGTGNEIVCKLTKDNESNIYVTGNFNEAIEFGNTTKIPVGDEDVYITKYHKSGALMWVQTIVGSDTQQAQAITTDNNKNIYLTGFFRQITSFADMSYTSAGREDIFIARLQM
jgi:hypothetical protein